MGSKPTTSVQKQVEALWQEGTTVGLTDGQLLKRFVDCRHATPEAAEAAFAAIVDRHGAMVLRTCRRILGEEHETQDAAQATFLVLARRAQWIADLRSVPDGCTRSRSGWRARRGSPRSGGECRESLRQVLGGTDGRTGKCGDDSERWAELYEELGRLPKNFRVPWFCATWKA